MSRELRLNAFAMNSVGHQSQGLWRHPRDRSVEYRRLDRWVELARLLERGKFDALFLADVLGGGPTVVGAPQRIADELEAWAIEADLDGFNLAYALMPETFSDVVDHLVPELQRRGRFKKTYRPGTYRHKLFGQGPRLGESHPAARHRCAIDTFPPAESART